MDKGRSDYMQRTSQFNRMNLLNDYIDDSVGIFRVFVGEISLNFASL